MRIRKTAILLFLVSFLALSLRIFRLWDFPKTLYGDEQAFAWNAYNILLTGQDEYGSPYPLQFRSFNDYKAPIPVYLLVPFIKFLGLNAFAIRLPIALVSVSTVLMTYFLARLFFNRRISLTVSFLLAISPWHVHLSRGYFESTLALSFLIIGIYFIVKSQTKLKMLLTGMFFLASSLYSYFTPRILVPLMLPFLLWYSVRINSQVEKTTLKKKILISTIFFILILLPLIKTTVFDKGFSRFDKLTGDTGRIVKETVNKERSTSNLPMFWRTVFHNKLTVWTRFIVNNYLEHLSFNFWYIYGDNSLRYFLGNMGMFYLWEMPFLFIGLYGLWREKKAAAVFFLGWILLAPIPASIVGRSFAVRSLAILPAPFVFVGYGIYKVISIIDHLKWKSLAKLFIASGFIGSLGIVLIRYYFEYPVYAATWWGWENKRAIDYSKERESQYDHIFISDFYTGAPLAFAVYSGYNPREFRKAVNNPVMMADGRRLIKLGKYYFGSLDIDAKRLEQRIIPPKSLYIGRPEEIDSEETINAPDDGRIIFKIYKTP